MKGISFWNVRPDKKRSVILLVNELTPKNKAISQRFYRKYVKDCKIKKDEIVTPKERVEIVDRIFSEIERSVLDNTGGVLIRKFGYFSVYKKHTNRKRGKLYKIGGYKHHFVFIPYYDDTDLKFFSMDFSNLRRYRKEIFNRLVAGHVYHCYQHSLKRFLQISEKTLYYRKIMAKKNGKFR